MSARPCGCDPQENYVCRVHLEEYATKGNVYAAALLNMKAVAPKYEDATDVEEPFMDKRGALDAELQLIYQGLRPIVGQLQIDVARIAAILATFYRAPLSMSSVAPILALAEELNPGLKETK